MKHLLPVMILWFLLAHPLLAQQKMYWTDAGTTDRVQRANLDGTDIDTLVTED